MDGLGASAVAFALGAHVPDHSTVAEFRVVRHERALSELFGDVLGLCRAAGLVVPWHPVSRAISPSG